MFNNNYKRRNPKLQHKNQIKAEGMDKLKSYLSTESRYKIQECVCGSTLLSIGPERTGRLAPTHKARTRRTRSSSGGNLFHKITPV